MMRSLLHRSWLLLRRPTFLLSCSAFLFRRLRLLWNRLFAVMRAKRHNLLVGGIAFVTMFWVYLSFDPVPAGSAIGNETVNVSAISQEISVPTMNGASQSGKSGTATGRQGNFLQGKTALLMSQLLLERGIKKLEKIDSYTTTFYKREQVDGKLLDGQVMQMKVRHKPFSVYMKWAKGDVGRELLYLDGQNEGKMLVKTGGVGGRLLPTIKLNPNGNMAKKEARYPVTQIGLLNLAKKIIVYRKSDLSKKSGVRCQMFDNQTINEQNCYCFVIEYENSDISKLYRKSVIFIEKENCLPICIKNFTWPDKGIKGSAQLVDKKTLIEDYRYSALRLDRKLIGSDFDRKNKNYRFIRH